MLLFVIMHYIISHIFSWFCHFDDDIYVNYPHLVTLLGKYNPYKEYRYIGRHPWPDSGKAQFIKTLPKMLKPVRQ